jgi:hypothetical protein
MANGKNSKKFKGVTAKFKISVIIWLENLKMENFQ